MKRSFLYSALMAVIIGAGVHAEEGKKCPMTGDCETQKAQRVEARVAELKKELGLSAEQETKVKATLEAAMTKKCAINEESSEKVSAIKESTSAELKGILTPDQQTKFDAMSKPCCVLAGQKGHTCPLVDKKAPCCAKAGEKGHKCPVKEKAAACCPHLGEKTKK
ncbi:MAG: hypothetical protein JNK54_03980 [Elusimicrobia bacterium]|jgi:hypothetical protein|nr:hypothetical protein [Elusimicrobiota bacterium]